MTTKKYLLYILVLGWYRVFKAYLIVALSVFVSIS